MNADGTWNAQIATPMGTQHVTIVLTVQDGVVTGTSSTNGDSTTLLDGTADDKRLTWKIEVSRPFAMTLAFDVAVDGDTMSGEVKAGSFPASKLTGTRA